MTHPQDLPVDHALTLFLQNDHEGALRWGAAALEGDPSMTSALLMTARLLESVGLRSVAMEGLRFAVERAAAEGDLPLALAAIQDLRSLGGGGDDDLARLAAVFCRGSAHLGGTPAASRETLELQPLSPILTGASLASRATEIVQAARRRSLADHAAPAVLAPHPLFSELPEDALRELFESFTRVDVAAGRPIVREGDQAAALYLVARGEVEISRRLAGDDRRASLVLGRVSEGGFFGEATLLGPLPGETTVIATRPSILLFARRAALETLVARHPEVGVTLEAHGRRHSIQNLGWTSKLIVSLPAAERALLADHVETRTFDKGERLVRQGADAPGLHLILAGDAALVVHDFGERQVLGTLGAGETVGEVELVLCCNARADCIALRPTTTLFLSRESFVRLVEQRPAFLHALYALAVRTRGRMKAALGGELAAPAGTEVNDDADRALLAEAEAPRSPRVARVTLPPPLPGATMVPAVPMAPRDVRLVETVRPPPSARPSISPSIPPTASTVPPPSRAARLAAVPASPRRASFAWLLAGASLAAALMGGSVALVFRPSAPPVAAAVGTEPVATTPVAEAPAATTSVAVPKVLAAVTVAASPAVASPPPALARARTRTAPAHAGATPANEDAGPAATVASSASVAPAVEPTPPALSRTAATDQYGGRE